MHMFQVKRVSTYIYGTTYVRQLYTVYDKNFAKRKFSPISPVDVNGENFFIEYFPNPTGPLSCELSSPAIAAANTAVNNLQQTMPKGVGAKKRGSYMIVGRGDENQDRKILQ